MSRYREIDLSNLRTYSASQRRSKVQVEAEAKPPFKGMTFRRFLDHLPGVLKAAELKELAGLLIRAKKHGKPVVAMLGGHVVKTGCCPVLIDMAEKGYISHFASNGAAAIHDVELARFGHTSEDVDDKLTDGSFGMAEDTASLVNGAAKRSTATKEGFGEALGALLCQENPPNLKRSLIARSYQLEVPFTLHVAIGTDIVHQHPSADGAAIGESSLRDFRILAATVAEIGAGGVVMNLGSAVVMPEVFLKCLAVSRNLKGEVKDFTTANFDMVQHYRPTVNVVTRPVRSGGRGFSITGHHEIMIPLLAAVIYETDD